MHYEKEEISGQMEKQEAQCVKKNHKLFRVCWQQLTQYWAASSVIG